MKVVIVEAAYGFGGSLTGLLDLLRYAPSDIEPVLVTPFDPWQHADPPPGLVHQQVDVRRPLPKSGGHWLPGLWRYHRDYYRPWDRVTREAIDRFEPDLVVANNSLSINFAVGRAAKRSGVPSVLHQKDFEYPGRLMRWMGRHAPFDRYLPMSRPLMEQLVDLGVPESRCHEVFDPMTFPDESVVRKRQDRLAHPPASSPVVAMHSMIVHWKGQHVFVEAIAKLHERGVREFRAVIAGAPPADEPDYLETLRQQARRCGVADAVEFPGLQRDVYDFLSGVDVAVHCSIDPEPFGRVVPEAMLMGIPVIVSQGGGPSQYVSDPATGRITPRGDAGSLADAIESMLRMSSRQRQALGEAGRESARQQFAPEPLAARMFEVYREAAGMSG